MVSALTNPALYASLAGLVTAITALVKIFQIQESQTAQHETLRAVQSSTDGQLTALHADVRALTARQATNVELAARPPIPPGA
jgi:hypothetical protein